MNAFLVFALLQTLNFVLLVVNIRAVAHVQYTWAVASDGAICLLTWTLLQKMTAAHDMASKAGYVTGGMVGSLIGIWISRVWG